MSKELFSCFEPLIAKLQRSNLNVCRGSPSRTPEKGMVRALIHPHTVTLVHTNQYVHIQAKLGILIQTYRHVRKWLYLHDT